MSASVWPSLVVDEGLLFLALRVLTEIEGRGKPFELLNITRDYSGDSDVGERFADAVGREIARDDREAIEYYIGAVYLLHHHTANLDQLPEALEPLEPPARDFVRMAAWTFLQAWTLRYGGLYGRLVNRGSTLIDPTVDDVG
jgi:hypothetical protein